MPNPMWEISQSLQSLQSLYLSQKHYYKCIGAVYKYIYFSSIKR